LTEAFSEERLTQLVERWHREPSSRIFVQLAEEYRRGGRLREALGVLERGLTHHPNYVSALVVLGRCRLEAGEPERAAEAFERALGHDPAQLVANKLIIEAHLRAGRPEKAKERLDFYRLFNDRDEEIEGLERRIAAASGARLAGRPVAPRAPASAPIFDLGPPPVRAAPAALAPPPAAPALRAPAPFGELREAAAAGRRIARALAAGGLFPMAIGPEPSPPPEARLEAPADLAPVPVAPVEAVPWWRGALAPVPPPEAPPAHEAAPAPEVAATPVAVALPPAEVHETVPPWGAGLRAAPELDLEARAEVVAAPFLPRTIGEEVERETIEEPFDEVLQASSTAAAMPRSEPEPAPPAWVAFEPAAEAEEVAAPRVEPVPVPYAAPVAPEPPVEAPATGAAVGPSATLGELYLQQGFVDEAEREFRAVLEVRPGDAVAAAGLDEIRRRRAGERPEAPPPRTLPAGLTRRKIETLRGYLDRLTRARESGLVS
jgi:tetratricopeptide (TPR) repeat protein